LKKKEKQAAPNNARAAREKLQLRSRGEPDVSSVAGFVHISEAIGEALHLLLAETEAEIERTCRFRGPVTEDQQNASNTIDRAHRALDQLTLEREEDEELEQARSKRQLARVTNR